MLSVVNPPITLASRPLHCVATTPNLPLFCVKNHAILHLHYDKQHNQGLPMFYRLIIDNLNEWRKSPVRKPLVLRGARQVGKTVAIRMFAKSYDHFSELNLEIRENTELFEQNPSPSEILQVIRLNQGIPLSATGSWLIFLDEIQTCPAAVAMLRYLYEENPDIHIIAAGSLLESALQREHISFPVGRV